MALARITHIANASQLSKILKASPKKLSVIDFHASWCGPCHAIAPTYEALSKKYQNVNFLKCDVDEVAEVPSSYQITAMPTFVFLKGENKVHQIRGADRSGLENAVAMYASDDKS